MGRKRKSDDKLTVAKLGLITAILVLIKELLALLVQIISWLAKP